jgi:hypothetical protein
MDSSRRYFDKLTKDANKSLLISDWLANFYICRSYQEKYIIHNAAMVASWCFITTKDVVFVQDISHTCKVDCRSQENYEKKILITTKESINKMNDHILRETCLAACTIKYVLLLTVRNDNHITYKNLLTYFLDDTSYMLLLIY